jgi:hypothetical protein
MAKAIRPSAGARSVVVDCPYLVGAASAIEPGTFLIRGSHEVATDPPSALDLTGHRVSGK